MGTRKQRVIEQEKYLAARALEGEKEVKKAVEGYQQIVKKNPLHIQAVSRLAILYRKLKLEDQELELLEKAVTNHQSHTEDAQREWIASHREIAEHSKPLAKMLGLLNENDLPVFKHEEFDRWKSRLDRLKEKINKSRTVKVAKASKHREKK